MTARHDILDRPESLRRPLAFSLVLHLAIAGVVMVEMTEWGGPREMFGDPSSLAGGAITISPVSQIPLPSRGGRVNPVANDTPSRVPQPPKPAPKKAAPKEDPKAVALPGPKSKAAKKQAAPQRASRYQAPGADQPNQLHSSSGAAIDDRLFGVTSGAGGVGIGAGSPFGSRFGYYEQLVRDKVARNWRTQEVDPRIQTAPLVIITFEILRNGSIRGLTVLQRSGILTLDNSCQRAIIESAPFPALPAGFSRDSARVEFRFELNR